MSRFGVFVLCALAALIVSAVGVLTSEHEGMPVSLMEAAACGVPVVATRVGGVPELVRDGETGLLAPAGDAAALADALAKMLGDASWRARLGAEARRRAEENFSVRHQGDQLLALWAEVLADGTPGRSASEFGDTNEAENSNQIGAPAGATPGRPQISVSDPFGAAGDAELPTLAHALNPVEAAHKFKRRLPKHLACSCSDPRQQSSACSRGRDDQSLLCGS